MTQKSTGGFRIIYFNILEMISRMLGVGALTLPKRKHRLLAAHESGHI